MDDVHHTTWARILHSIGNVWTPEVRVAKGGEDLSPPAPLFVATLKSI